ncbi:hypothetical protein TL16_g06923 [Triparma laevis f. inornata]|uniref:BZIP domain-containing protein n=1 Tax=Triparma laevis f. inornata TaxID=1714386 RepID=A0A9W7ATZ3_9STRA|nr:hypothetical protein TL16_g06923 [Triparma laevis f. inornata]
MRSSQPHLSPHMERIDTTDFPDDFLTVFNGSMQRVNSISEFKDILTSPSLHSVQNPTLAGPQAPNTNPSVSVKVEPKRTTSALSLDGLGSLRPNTSFACMSSLKLSPQNPSTSSLNKPHPRSRAHSLTIEADSGFLGGLPTSYSSNGITFTNSNFDTTVFPDCEPVYEEDDEQNFAEQNFYANRPPSTSTEEYGGQYYGEEEGYGEEESYEEESANANGKRNRKPSAKKMENGYDRKAPPNMGAKQAVEYQQQIYPPPLKISEESLAVFNPLAANMAARGAPGFRPPFKRTLLAPPPPHLTPAHVAALTSTNWVTACQAANSNGNVVKDAVARSTGKIPGGDEGGESKRRRMNLSAEDRAKQNRDRNREHARNTRLRKKAYVEELKRTLTEMVNQREAEYKNEIINKQRTEKAKEIRLQVLTAFMNFRGSNNQDPNAYACIIEPGFSMTIPQTPYRQFVKKESKSGEEAVGAGSVPAHPHNQTFESIEEVMQDSCYLFNMLQGLGNKTTSTSSATPSALVFHPILNTVSMEDELLNCQFNTISTNCRQNGASDELRIFGHVQAEYDMESNKLTKLNLMFDTFSVAYQLSSLTPLTVVDNSCPSSPVAKAKKSNLVGGGVPVEQDKLLMIHHQDNNRFIGVLSNPVEQKMSLEGIKTDEQKKFEKKHVNQNHHEGNTNINNHWGRDDRALQHPQPLQPGHQPLPPQAQVHAPVAKAQQPPPAIVNNNISDSDDGSDSGKDEALSKTTRRSGRNVRTRAR